MYLSAGKILLGNINFKYICYQDGKFKKICEITLL